MQQVIRWSRNLTRRPQTVLCHTDILSCLLQFQKGFDSWIAAGYSSRVHSWPNHNYLTTSSHQLWNRPWKRRVNGDANCATATTSSLATPGGSCLAGHRWQQRSGQRRRAPPALAFRCCSEVHLFTLNTSLHLVWESKSSTCVGRAGLIPWQSVYPCLPLPEHSVHSNAHCGKHEHCQSGLPDRRSTCELQQSSAPAACLPRDQSQRTTTLPCPESCKKKKELWLGNCLILYPKGKPALLPSSPTPQAEHLLHSHLLI